MLVLLFVKIENPSPYGLDKVSTAMDVDAVSEPLKSCPLCLQKKNTFQVCVHDNQKVCIDCYCRWGESNVIIDLPPACPFCRFHCQPGVVLDRAGNLSFLAGNDLKVMRAMFNLSERRQALTERNNDAHLWALSSPGQRMMEIGECLSVTICGDVSQDAQMNQVRRDVEAMERYMKAARTGHLDRALTTPSPPAYADRSQLDVRILRWALVSSHRFTVGHPSPACRQVMLHLQYFAHVASVYEILHQWISICSDDRHARNMFHRHRVHGFGNDVVWGRYCKRRVFGMVNLPYILHHLNAFLDSILEVLAPPPHDDRDFPATGQEMARLTRVHLSPLDDMHCNMLRSAWNDTPPFQLAAVLY